MFLILKYLYIVINNILIMKKKIKKVGTTFTINPKIIVLLNDNTQNKSKLIEWLLLNYFKSIGKNIDDIIL